MQLIPTRTAAARCSILLALMPVIVMAQGFEVGQALLVNGAVTAATADGEPRLLDRGAPVYETDTITTASKSFTVLKLRDGTKMSLRPDSVFRIDEYVFPGEQQKATYNLVKGGLRALTGLIGKDDPRANVLNSRVGSMGIRGTEFDARLCGDDCAPEQQALESAHGGSQPVASQVIGRVVLVSGEAAAGAGESAPRALARGGPLYVGDSVVTGPGAHLVVAFTDGSKLSVRPDTELSLAEYAFEKDSEVQPVQKVELVSGGLRALTGLIGNLDPSQVRFSTRVGSMGIRGTGFDLYYENPAYVRVWSGEVAFCAGGGDCADGGVRVVEGQILRVEPGREPEFLDVAPTGFEWPDDTRPDRFDIDLEQLFSTREHDFTEAGMLVTVYDGHVIMYPLTPIPEGADIREVHDNLEGVDIGAGESLFSDGAVIYRLDNAPLIQYLDPTVKPGSVSESNADIFALFPGTSGSGGMMCTIE